MKKWLIVEEKIPHSRQMERRDVLVSTSMPIPNPMPLDTVRVFDIKKLQGGASQVIMFMDQASELHCSTET